MLHISTVMPHGPRHDVAVQCLHAISEYEELPLEKLVAEVPERLDDAKERSRGWPCGRRSRTVAMKNPWKAMLVESCWCIGRWDVMCSLACMMSKCGDPTCTDEKQQQLVHWAKFFLNSNGCYVLLEYYPIKWMQIADVHRFSPGQLLVSNMPVISPPGAEFFTCQPLQLWWRQELCRIVPSLCQVAKDLHHDGLLFIGWGSKTYQDDGKNTIGWWWSPTIFPWSDPKNHQWS